MILPQGYDTSQSRGLLNEIRRRPRFGVNTNCIINPSGIILQRPSNGGIFDGSGPYNNDTADINDRFKLYSQSNDAVDVNFDATNQAIKYTWQKNEQGMLGQNVLAENVLEHRNVYISASVELKSSTPLSVRFGVLSWAGTSNSITNDIVSAWGEDITWVTNLSEIDVSDVLVTPTADFKRYEVNNILVPSNMNNLILVVYSSTAPAIGNILYMRKMKIEKNKITTPYNQRFTEDEYDLCQYYYESLYLVVNGLCRTDAANYVMGGTYFYRNKRLAAPTITGTGWGVYEEGSAVNQQASYTKSAAVGGGFTGKNYSYMQVYKAIGGSKPSQVRVTLAIDAEL